MADEIADGVWWLSGTRGCNVYLVRADDGSFVLIDAAFASSAGAIVRESRAITAHAPITHVLLTHNHFDHVGSARRVASELGARVAAGAADCERLNGRWALSRSEPRRSRAARSLVSRMRMFGGQPAPTEVDDVLTGSAEVAPGIDAVPVPGHTPGSYCYLARTADVCFVGDLVISHRSGLARSLAPANLDDPLYLDGMLKFSQIALDMGCPGHGDPVGGFPAALERLAREPRKPWTLQNAAGRIGRLAAFAGYILLQRQ